jgi:hypothetical protein
VIPLEARCSYLFLVSGTLQQGTYLEFSVDSRGFMGMGVVHESQMAQPVPDPREAARRTLNMYFRYSWPLLDHYTMATNKYCFLPASFGK